MGGGPGCPLAASHVGVRRGAKLGADWTILLDVSRHFICAQHSTDHTQPSALFSLSLSLSLRHVMSPRYRHALDHPTIRTSAASFYGSAAPTTAGWNRPVHGPKFLGSARAQFFRPGPARYASSIFRPGPLRPIDLPARTCHFHQVLLSTFSKTLPGPKI